MELKNLDLEYLRNLADRYGELKAHVAEAQERLDILKEMILETEQDVLEGKLFRVTVSAFEKSSVDVKSLEAKFPQIVEQFRRFSTVTTVRCSSR